MRTLNWAPAAIVSVLLLPAAGLLHGSDLRLIEAVRNRDAAAAGELVRKGADVNATQPDGATALHWAAQWDDVDTARTLIRAGARVDAANDYGVTAAVLAATNGSARMLDLLLTAGANPNAALPTGETLLMTAARTGNPAALRALLARGANVAAAQTSRGQTALMWAVAETHTAAVRVLLEAGASVGARSLSGFTALLFAAREGDLTVAQLLLDGGADVNESSDDGSTPLLVAAVRGHVELAMLLLARGAAPEGNPEAAGYTPLHWASGTFEGITALDYPVESGEWTALAGIRDRQAKLSLINALLNRGADVNARVSKDPPRYGFTLFRRNHIPGATPFYLAALSADVEVMRLLASRGADTKVPARDGTTPLIVAAGVTHNNESRVTESQRIEAVTLALDLGNDIDAQNKAGQSAMHAAAHADQAGVIDLLAARGAALNQKANNGQTPLGLAEGSYFDGSIVERPLAAAALRNLGAVSEGRAMKEAAQAPRRAPAAVKEP